MELKDILTLCVALLATSCTDPSQDHPTEDPPAFVDDAQFICDVLTGCFALELGPTCAADIEATTTGADISTCAACLDAATCATIGEPGTPGVCDEACYAAWFGGAS